jgi:hypothetical protein
LISVKPRRLPVVTIKIASIEANDPGVQAPGSWRIMNGFLIWLLKRFHMGPKSIDLLSLLHDSLTVAVVDLPDGTAIPGEG